MLKICVVYFDGFYTPDYVTNLYNSLRKHTTVDFEFVCLSDNKNVKADTILPYNHHSDIKKHWHKLKFFSPLFSNQQPNDDIIIMDIDQVILQNIDDLLNWPVENNELVAYGQWWENKLGINGGFYKFKSGSLKFIWDDFIKAPDYWQLHYYNSGVVDKKWYGEQNYVKWKIQEHNAKLTKTPAKWLCKYTDDYKQNLELQKTYCKKFNTDYMILGNDVNKMIKVIHFTGVGRKINANYLR